MDKAIEDKYFKVSNRADKAIPHYTRSRSLDRLLWQLPVYEHARGALAEEIAIAINTAVAEANT